MHETQARGMQEHASQRRERNFSGLKLVRRAVRRVAHQRMSGRREVRANLVRTACARLSFNQREISESQ